MCDVCGITVCDICVSVCMCYVCGVLGAVYMLCVRVCCANPRMHACSCLRLTIYKSVSYINCDNLIFLPIWMPLLIILLLLALPALSVIEVVKTDIPTLYLT